MKAVNGIRLGIHLNTDFLLEQLGGMMVPFIDMGKIPGRKCGSWGQ